MEKARDKFVIGQLVEVIVHNNTYGCIGTVVAFNEHNEYNVKVAFDGDFKSGFEQGYMTNELRPIPRLGHKLSFVGKLKRAYYRWRNSDPIKHCPVYLKEGCVHVDGMLCNFPDCHLYHERMGHTFCACANCLLNSNCSRPNYGLGCYEGKLEDYC